MNCPICLEKAFFFRKIVGNINIPKDNSKYILYKCRVCDHVFRANHLRKHIYTSKYYSYSASKNSLFKFVKFFFMYSKYPLGSFFWEIIQNLTRYQNCPYIKNGIVLDVGGGDGFALNLYKLSNNKTYNIELFDSVIEISRKNGHRTFRNISDLMNTKFDLIRINHVLEHIDDPKRVIELLYPLLKKKGVIVVGIPNINSLSFKLLGQLFDQLSFPDHIHFFSEKSLMIIFKQFEHMVITYPLHKYGFLTNIYTILNKKNKFFNNFLIYIPFLVFSFPFNFICSFFKRTHLMNVYCYKS